MKRVLVTGGAGFIGSNVVRLLTKRGYRVVVLDNLTTGYLENLEGIQGADFVKGDVTDADTLENVVKENGVEMIFHLSRYRREFEVHRVSKSGCTSQRTGNFKRA